MNRHGGARWRLGVAAIGALALTGCGTFAGVKPDPDLAAEAADELTSALEREGAQDIMLLHTISSPRGEEAWAAQRSREGELCLMHILTVPDEGSERSGNCRADDLTADGVEELARDLVPPDRRLLVFRTGREVEAVAVQIDGEPQELPTVWLGGERLAWGVVVGPIGEAQPVTATDVD